MENLIERLSKGFYSAYATNINDDQRTATHSITYISDDCNTMRSFGIVANTRADAWCFARQLEETAGFFHCTVDGVYSTEKAQIVIHRKF